MSPSSLRVLAGAVAALLALLTAIAVGLVSASARECAPVGTSVPAPSAVPITPSPTGGLGGRVEPEGSAPASSAVASPPVPQPAATGCGDFAVAPAVTALAGAAATGSVVLVLLLLAGARRGRPPTVVPPTVVPPTVPASTRGGPPAPDGRADTGRADTGRADTGRADAERAALVRACIYLRDRVSSRALADRIAAALHEAGVAVVEPVGERFDPARHEAGGTTPATDATQVGTIAGVEVPGYVERSGRVLRAPVVTVYQAPAGNRPSSISPARRAEEDR